MNERYAGKPLLRLLELYMLWSIGELSEEDARTLEAMTPQLQQVYNSKAPWQGIIAQIFDMKPEMPAAVKRMWDRNQDIARDNGQDLTPQQFAEMIVDQNFKL